MYELWNRESHLEMIGHISENGHEELRSRFLKVALVWKEIITPWRKFMSHSFE